MIDQLSLPRSILKWLSKTHKTTNNGEFQNLKWALIMHRWHNAFVFSKSQWCENRVHSADLSTSQPILTWYKTGQADDPRTLSSSDMSQPHFGEILLQMNSRVCLSLLYLNINHFWVSTGVIVALLQVILTELKALTSHGHISDLFHLRPLLLITATESAH